MAKFIPNEAVITKEPVVEVDAGLTPGKYRFQLVVVNNQGVQSPPVFATVRILRRRPGIPPIVPPVIRPNRATRKTRDQ